MIDILSEEKPVLVPFYYLRIGSLGEIHVASALLPLSRGQTVVVRSPDGIEMAEITAPCKDAPDRRVRYRVVRPATDADQLLVKRLERYKREAIDSCRKRLSEVGCQATLLDVDQLLDGGTLRMQFLGDVDPIAQEIADDVAQRYESVVRSNHLSELLQEGCGDGCGESGSCGDACSGCSGCG